MRYVAILILWINSIDCWPQVNYVELKETIDFVFQQSNGKILLGSTDGLFSFDAINTPVKSKFNFLDNKNIQSSFYPDANGRILFCTYNRIVQLDPSNGNTKEFQIVLDSVTLKEDYHVFAIDTIESLLWVKQSHKLIAFNTKDHISRLLCDSIDGYRILKTEHDNITYLFSYYHTYNPAIIKISEEADEMVFVSYWKNWPKKTIATEILPFSSKVLLIGTTKGLLLGNIELETIEPLLIHEFVSGVRAIGEYKKNEWIVSTRDSLLYLLIFNGSNFSLRKFPYSGIAHPVNRIYTSSDNTIFLSSHENGIYFFNPGKIKFTNWNPDTYDEIANGIFESGKLKKYYKSTDVTASGKPYVFNDNLEMFCEPGYQTSRIVSNKALSIIPNPDSNILFRYYRSDDNKIYANFQNAGLFEFTHNTWKKVNYPYKFGWEFNYYYPINDSLSLASINMSRLVMWNPKTLNHDFKEIIFTGDIYNQYFDKTKNLLYIATERGLATLNISNKHLELIKDKHESSCLCILPDKSGKIWYSSQSGVTQYDPSLQLHRYFYSSDGASTEKYSGRKCLALSSDSLLFFHTSGATLVVPSMIKTLNIPAKIFISGMKINDLDYTAGDTLNYCTDYTLAYENNTLSFEITAIDWSDPTHTNLRYKLHNYDDAWVQPDRNNIFVRYANLPPGKYTLLIQGANSDAVWNKEIRKLAITVIPPFYLTWWFLSLAVLASILFIYWLIKSYYQRKLQKKNQLLREQALIIEKQQAVENERTRIASEMHDDLGSGLTTIRYLSDKALKQAKDSEEAVQIKRIADHSNTLVRNMSEIIWAMNSRFDNTENLIGYLRRYASEYLDERQMPFTFEANGTDVMVSIGGEKRRNIFLVFKELLHNSVKYSNAKSIVVSIQTSDHFIIRISELGGKGFDPELSTEKGNGLFNCQKRLNSIDGHIDFQKTDDAMNIIISVPLNVPNLA